MAVDPQAPVAAETSLGLSPIENEIPTYRAISPMAITSLILGLVAVGTFASGIFAVAGVLAVLAGAIAERNIRRAPDALTGRTFAQVGIALGLVFTLSALTFVYVRDLKVRSDASRFAETYAEVLQSGSLEDAFWYRSPSHMRTGKTASKMLTEFEQAVAAGGDPTMRNEQIGAIEQILIALRPPGSTVRFHKLEKSGYNEVTPYAFVVYEIKRGAHDESDHEEGDHEHGAGSEYALVHIESNPTSPTFDWSIQKILYPYSLSSVELAPKAIDDGHGHSH